MTVRERGLREARRVAREVTKRWGIKRAEDIRVEAIAKAEGLRIVEGPLRGARGRLSSGPMPVIRIAENTINEGARRFTIGHELGHHLLRHPAHGSEGACASARASDVPNASERDCEAEANAFASELLLPRHLVAPKCEGAPTLDIPRAIAFEFLMSVPASAIRYVQLTRARCAALYSERGAIEWAPKSHGFKTRFVRGHALPMGSMALECAQHANVHDEARTVPASVWFDTKERVEVVEHSAPVSEAGGVITLLWVPDVVADRVWPRTA